MATMNHNWGIAKVVLGTLLVGFFLPLASLEASTSAFNSKVRADALLKEGQIEAAIGLYERILKEDPKFANAYYNLATAYYLGGDVKQASENLERLVGLSPRDTEALYNLACLKLRMGAFDEAEEYFRKAWDGTSSSSPFCLKIKEALQFLKDLRQENPETQELLAYLLTGSGQALLASLT